jgi:hypothetical protein
MSAVFGAREGTIVAGSNSTVEVVGCGQQQKPAGLEAAVDVPNELSIVEDMLDIFAADCHLEALLELSALAESPDIPDRKFDLIHSTKSRPLRGDPLVASIPAQAHPGISPPSCADSKSAGAAADVDKPLAVAGAGQAAAQPEPAVQHQQIVVDKRRRKPK